MDFVEWMRAVDLSEKSIRSYFGAINGRLTTWAKQYGLTTKSILDITDVNELNALIGPLSRTTEFINRNATGNSMYSAALGNYQKYLQALASQYHGKPNDYDHIKNKSPRSSQRPTHRITRPTKKTPATASCAKSSSGAGRANSERR